MPNQELDQRIATHQGIIEELNRLSPEIEAYQMKISRFILTNPIILGISYQAAEVLMKEKDPNVRQNAIKIIGEDLQRRRNPDSLNYRLMYRAISGSRVRKILLECRPKCEKGNQALKRKEVPLEITCPHCKKEITYVQENRENVVSFRGTEITDNAIDYLASRLGVSRSVLANKLLRVEQKYGYGLKK